MWLHQQLLQQQIRQQQQQLLQQLQIQQSMRQPMLDQLLQQQQQQPQHPAAHQRHELSSRADLSSSHTHVVGGSGVTAAGDGTAAVMDDASRQVFCQQNDSQAPTKATAAAAAPGQPPAPKRTRRLQRKRHSERHRRDRLKDSFRQLVETLVRTDKGFCGELHHKLERHHEVFTGEAAPSMPQSDKAALPGNTRDVGAASQLTSTPTPTSPLWDELRYTSFSRQELLDRTIRALNRLHDEKSTRKRKATDDDDDAGAGNDDEYTISNLETPSKPVVGAETVGSPAASLAESLGLTNRKVGNTFVCLLVCSMPSATVGRDRWRATVSRFTHHMNSENELQVSSLAWFVLRNRSIAPYDTDRFLHCSPLPVYVLSFFVRSHHVSGRPPCWTETAFWAAVTMATTTRTTPRCRHRPPQSCCQGRPTRLVELPAFLGSSPGVQSPSVLLVHRVTPVRGIPRTLLPWFPSTTFVPRQVQRYRFNTNRNKCWVSNNYSWHNIGQTTQRQGSVSSSALVRWRNCTIRTSLHLCRQRR